MNLTNGKQLEITPDVLSQAKDAIQSNESRFKPDHDRLATTIANELRNEIAYFYSDFYGYDRGCWTKKAIQQINLSLRQWLRKKRRDGWDIKITGNLVNSVVRLMSDDLFVDDTAIDQADKYINLRNGLFNLETRALEEHRPELYPTTQLDFDYNPDADYNNWLRYLNSSLVHPDTGKTDFKLIELLQEALAYSMTARTDLKASFWLIGKPDSGKSTLITLLRSMLGELHTTIDLNQLGGTRFMLAGMAGKRVATFTEAKTNSMLADDIFKTLVGGTDEIYADVKNKNAITFVPKVKLWWAMNEAPRTNDRSGAVFNRLYAIPFNRSIPKSERINNLSELLHHERSGIFTWAMYGYERLVRRGSFTIVKQSEDLKEEYRLINDTEDTFIRECAIRDTESNVQSSELYDEYKNWCRLNSFIPKNANQIVKEWERLGLEKRRRNGLNFWYGIRLNTKTYA